MLREPAEVCSIPGHISQNTAPDDIVIFASARHRNVRIYNKSEQSYCVAIGSAVVQFCLVKSPNTNTAILPSIFDSVQRSIAQGWPWWHILIYFLYVPTANLNTIENYMATYPHDMTEPHQRKLSTVALIEEIQIKKTPSGL